jgi:tetratricopeptide (TPR) repeat protein
VEPLVARRRDRARELEKTGQLRRALEEWKIALTLKPDDPAALEGKRQLEARIEQEIGRRVREGREALARGDQLGARRHFLAVLAIDPANVTAFEALRSEVKEVRFVTHTVRPRETLASIAERYYGDRSRAEVIWEVNELPPNPRITAGMMLRIPEIPGVPFLVDTPRPPGVPAAGAPTPGAPSASREEPRPETPGAREEARETNPLLLEAREALERGDYLVALADVDKLLAANAQNPEGIELKKSILYGLGKTQLAQRRYDESYQTLTQLARLAPNYQDSGALLQEARERLIQYHYTQGIRLFQEEKLEPAIAQWKKVLEYDPQHANAKRNIDQAERVLRNLQQRKQAPQPAPQPPPKP